MSHMPLATISKHQVAQVKCWQDGDAALKLPVGCKMKRKFLRYGRVSVSWFSFYSSNQGMIYTQGRWVNTIRGIENQQEETLKSFFDATNIKSTS